LSAQERNDIRNYLAGEGQPMTTDLLHLYAGNSTRCGVAC